jgi:Lhr-like helicase
MQVEEHTAQLTTNATAEMQTTFTREEVNVLNCSTTFELGVDAWFISGNRGGWW